MFLLLAGLSSCGGKAGSVPAGELRDSQGIETLSDSKDAAADLAAPELQDQAEQRQPETGETEVPETVADSNAPDELAAGGDTLPDAVDLEPEPADTADTEAADGEVEPAPDSVDTTPELSGPEAFADAAAELGARDVDACEAEDARPDTEEPSLCEHVEPCPPLTGALAQCRENRCSPASGKCEERPFREGEACNDGNLCSYGEVCVNGGCAGGKPVNCRDDNPCTDDVCYTAQGCQNVPNHAACNDGDFCTIGDYCQDGQCRPGTQTFRCDDGNQCTLDSCASKTGCIFQPLSGLACDDNDPCTAAGTCKNGLCQTAPKCSDGLACTKDICDAKGNCLYAPLSPCCPNGIEEPGEDCDDGNSSYGDDCDPGCICPFELDCAAGCCERGQVCYLEECCTPDCQGRACGSDGCGGSCGACTEAEGCVELPVSGSACLPAGQVLVPAGTFTMGSPLTELGRKADELQHQVTLSYTLAVMKTKLSQGEFLELMGYNPAYFQACGKDCPIEMVNWYEALYAANRRSEKDGLAQCFDCTGTPPATSCKLKMAYAIPQDCLGWRLPTEAEWEYFARAGTTTAFFTGDLVQMGYSPLDPALELAGWYAGNSAVGYTPAYDCSTLFTGGSPRCGTQRSAMKLANPWGLYDVAGNVWEWCWDWYVAVAGTAGTDPVGPASGTSKLLRGGAWNYKAEFCRAAIRGAAKPSGRYSYFGFRLVRTLWKQ